MKNKTSLLLMEQLMMILVFSLAAALCLQVFAKAHEISQETARQDQAVILARNAAEVLKATDGDLDAAETLSQDGYRVSVTLEDSPQPGLACAVIGVFWEDTQVYSLKTGWQEVLP